MTDPAMTDGVMTDGAVPDTRPVHTRIEHAVLGTVGAVSRHRVAGPAVVVAAAVGCCTAIWFADPTTPGGPLPMCPTTT